MTDQPERPQVQCGSCGALYEKYGAHICVAQPVPPVGATPEPNVTCQSCYTHFYSADTKQARCPKCGRILMLCPVAAPTPREEPTEEGQIVCDTCSLAVEDTREHFNRTGHRTFTRVNPALDPELEKIAKQLICTHRDCSGGNDYLECHKCGLVWDYGKSNPLIALKKFNHPISRMAESRSSSPAAPELLTTKEERESAAWAGEGLAEQGLKAGCWDNDFVARPQRARRQPRASPKNLKPTGANEQTRPR